MASLRDREERVSSTHSSPARSSSLRSPETGDGKSGAGAGVQEAASPISRMGARRSMPTQHALGLREEDSAIPTLRGFHPPISEITPSLPCRKLNPITDLEERGDPGGGPSLDCHVPKERFGHRPLTNLHATPGQNVGLGVGEI